MKRIIELDGIRGIAILLVLIWHYFASQAQEIHSNLIYYLKYSSALTWSGVDLFFVLSGFLIGGILLDQRNSSGYLRTFFIRRVCRIFPLYFLIIFLFIILSKIAPRELDWLFADPHSLWAYATFTQNYLMGSGGFGPHWLGITWSLAIEEQFYVFLPFLMYFIRANWLVPVLVMMIIVGPASRYLVEGLGSYVFSFCRADTLMMGVLLAWLVRHNGILNLTRRFNSLIIATFCMLFLVVWYLTYSLTATGDVVNHFVFALWYALLVLLAVMHQGSRSAGILRTPLLLWLGSRSYGIFLFHQGSSGLWHGLFGNLPPRMSNYYEILLTVFALVTTLIVAELSFRYYESYFIKLGHQFKYMPIDK